MDLDKIVKKIRNSELSEEDVLKYGRILITEFAKEYHNEAINYTRCCKSVICCPQCGNERLEDTGGGWYICRDMYCDWGDKL